MAVTTARLGPAPAVTVLALWRIEGARRRAGGRRRGPDHAAGIPCGAARRLGRSRLARRFAVFVFLSMLAPGAQDLILEPFAGAVMGFTPGQSTSLSGVQHNGVLAGMLMAGFAGSPLAQAQLAACADGPSGLLASAVAMAGLVAAGLPDRPGRSAPTLPARRRRAFSIAAIGSMMQLASEGGGTEEACAWACGAPRPGHCLRPRRTARHGGQRSWRGWSSTAPGAAYASVFRLRGRDVRRRRACHRRPAVPPRAPRPRRWRPD